MYCPRCGNIVSSEDKFCRKCGAELSPETVTSERTMPQSSKNTAAKNKKSKSSGDRLKIVFPLAIMTVILLTFIAVLIILINRPETEPDPKVSSGIPTIETASVERETTTTTTTTTTTATTTTVTTTAVLTIQDLAEFSDGEILAEPAAVSEDGISIVYHPTETDGNMFYCVEEWLDYLEDKAELEYIGSVGSGILYTEYYDYDSDEINKKKIKVDGKSKKQDYVLALEFVADTDSDAVLRVTVNFQEGIETEDLLIRYSGRKRPLKTTTASKNKKSVTTKKTTTTAAKKTTAKTTSKKTVTTKKTTMTTVKLRTDLQDIVLFSDNTLKLETEKTMGNILVKEYAPIDPHIDITDIVTEWINLIFEKSDFEYIGINEENDKLVYYFDCDGIDGAKIMANVTDVGQTECTLEITCFHDPENKISKITVKSCDGINIIDMDNRF